MHNLALSDACNPVCGIPPVFVRAVAWIIDLRNIAVSG